MSTESGAVPQGLLALARAAAAPQLTGAALDRRFGPRSTWVPAVGQVWRAVREDVTALVLLLDVNAESAAVAPVTVEASDAVETVVLEDTVFEMPVTVWVGLTRRVPMSVLDRLVDNLATGVLTQLAEQGAARPAGHVLRIDDVGAELSDDLARLAVMPAATFPSSIPAGTPGIDVAALEPEALEEARARLAVPMPVVLDLVDGKRLPTPAEAEVLRQLLGAAPEALPPPAGLVQELSQPRWRGLVRQHCHRAGLTEDEARSALAWEIHAMAARQTGDAAPSWPDRIRRWAQAHQLDPDADA